MILLFICLIVILAILIGIHFANNDNPLIIVTILISIALGGCIETCIENENPTALDVYRGNTKLQITYVDSTAIDSIVVFKDKEK